MTQYAIVNGMRKEIPDHVTSIGEARRHFGVAENDILMDVRTGKSAPLKATDPFQDTMKIASFPQITKGSASSVLSPWLDQDLQLLRSNIGGRHTVETKGIHVGGTAYTAVAVANVRMNEKKFGTVSATLLFLLPLEYPALPPLGVYIHFPFENKDHHFTLQSYYGAPDLREKGWYWYCLRRPESTQWRPASTPAGGHNLISLFAAARYAINSD